MREEVKRWFESVKDDLRKAKDNYTKMDTKLRYDKNKIG